MKKYFLIIVITLMFTAICQGGEGNNVRASAIAVESITNYYSSMIKAGVVPFPDSGDLMKKVAFYIDNHDMIVSQIVQEGASNNLDRAIQVSENLYKKSIKHLSYSRPDTHVNGKGYFDAATGHKYIKNDDGSYAEYTRKGQYLKTVPSDLPLLTTSRNIHPITEDSYILYETTLDGKKAYLSMPGFDAHPEDYKTCKILVSLK